MDPRDFLPLAQALTLEGVDYKLVGAVALAVQGLVRATGDIDIFVRPSEANVQRLRAALQRVYADDSVEEIETQDLAGDYAVVRYGPPQGDYVIDILGRLGERWEYDDIDSEVRELDGVQITVATPRMLYLMKRDTLRPKDQIDVLALRDHFGLEDLD